MAEPGLLILELIICPQTKKSPWTYNPQSLSPPSPTDTTAPSHTDLWSFALTITTLFPLLTKKRKKPSLRQLSLHHKRKKKKKNPSFTTALLPLSHINLTIWATKSLTNLDYHSRTFTSKHHTATNPHQFTQSFHHVHTIIFFKNNCQNIIAQPWWLYHPTTEDRLF